MSDNDMQPAENDPFAGPPPVTDRLIQGLVLVANIGVGQGITLLVGGKIITGRLLPGAAYMERMADYVRSSTDDESMISVVDTIAGLFDTIRPHYTRPDDPNSDWNYPANFIHLEDASVFDGSGTVQLGLWRGRIADISGFSLGQLQRG